MDKSFAEKIAGIQSVLVAPKSQYNSFGKYSYRNCEDILEAVKPLLSPLGMIITVCDEVIGVGDRVYIKATATISDGEHSISNTAYAREALSKKGMDDSQVTGSTSSYARKYALNGLLAIDDSKDADHCAGKENESPVSYPVDDTAKQWISAIKDGRVTLDEIVDPSYREFIKANVMA